MRYSRTISGLALLLTASCAIAEEDNRRTLNWLDAHAAPAAATSRWALAPVALPVGVAALALDACVVHPCTAIDDAWGDTVEWLWHPREESDLRRWTMVPVRAVATPFTFAGDWLVRAVFAIPARREVEPEEPAPTTEVRK